MFDIDTRLDNMSDVFDALTRAVDKNQKMTGKDWLVAEQNALDVLLNIFPAFKLYNSILGINTNKLREQADKIKASGGELIEFKRITQDNTVALAGLNEEVERLEKAFAKETERQAAKSLSAELKDLKQQKKDLEQQVKNEIKLQAELDEIDRKLLATLKAIAVADKQLTLANMEKNALFDNQITIQEKLIINDEKWMQVQEKLATAQKEFDTAGVAAAQKELNAVKKESVSLKLQELDQETRGLILVQNRAVLDGNKSELDAEQNIIDVQRNQLAKQYFDILETDDKDAMLSYKEAVLALDVQQNELDEKSIALKTQLIDMNIQAAEQVLSSANTAIGAVESNWRAIDNANKKEELSNARTQKQKDDIEVKYAKKAEDRAKKLQGWKIATAVSNVALGITQTWRDPNLPVWAKAIAITAQAAAGYAQIATIRGQEFEQGGLVGGRRHSQGGTMIEAEQGEFVMSRSAVESVGMENLNRMNEGGGGGSVTVNVSGNVLSQDFVEGELAENIKEAIRRGTDFGIS